MTIIFDTKQLDKMLQKISLNPSELQEIEAPGGETLKRGMKQRAAVDTGYMKNNVFRHVVKADANTIEDDVGSDAPYGVYQEFGTGIYAENGLGRKTPWVYRSKDGKFHTTSGNRPHPFVRPTVREDFDKVIKSIRDKFEWVLKKRWK
jgi:HK97 gp10 family phage protein